MKHIKAQQFYKTMWNPLYEGTSHPQFSYKDLIEFASEFHEDALKNMESSSRIMSAKRTLESFAKWRNKNDDAITWITVVEINEYLDSNVT